MSWLGSKTYLLEAEHAPMGDSYGVQAILVMNKVKYEGVIIYRFDDVINAVNVDLKAEKHFALEFTVKFRKNL